MDYIQFLRENARWLAAGALMAFSSSYGQTYFISIFAGEIRETFSLSHGQWGGIYTLGTGASAVVMIWSGVLTDRYRVRHLGTAVMIGLALACLFMSALPYVWLLPLAIFALRFTGQGMASHIATVAMARWFVATRGRALSIATMGFAFGQAILPIIFVSLLAVMHWRSIWVIAALLSLATIPVLIVLLKEERTPQSIAKNTPSVGMDGRHWQRKELLRHSLFWLLLLSFLGPSAWGTALMFQQVHLAEIKDWTHLEFVAMLPLLTGVSVVSTLVTGWAVDRFGTALLMPFSMLPYALGFMVLAAANDLWMLALGLSIFGAGMGITSTLPGAFSAEFFGTRYIGSIKALFAAIMVLGSAIGPGVTGYLIDYGIDFQSQMIGIAIYFLVAAAMVTVGVRIASRALPTTA